MAQPLERQIIERARALIGIAHPAVRDALRERLPELPPIPPT